MPAIKNIQYSTLTSGTLQINDTSDDIQVIQKGASLAVALTIALPLTPVDGQRVFFSSVKGITSLTLSTSVGTIATLISTLAAGSTSAWIYSGQDTIWYKHQ